MQIVRKPPDKSEEKIFKIWKALNPSSAFTSGLNHYAGKLFVHTEENERRMLKEIAKLKTQTKGEVQKKLLQCFETGLLFEEPHMVLENALSTYYAHLVKEGINAEHLLSLTSYASEALQASKRRLGGKRWPLEIRIITCYAGNSFLGILETIRKETKNKQLREEVATLKKIVTGYLKAFYVKGVKDGTFEEVSPLLKEGGDIGRKKEYPKLLKDLYDYPETADEIESKALKWLKEELPRLMEITEKLAKIYFVEPDVERIADEMTKRQNVDKRRVIEFVSNMRKKLQKVVEICLVKITSTYDTRIVETPSYLASLFTKAASSSFDILTKKPFNLFFVTTDPKRSSPTSAPDLIQTIIHEEYGHCINSSNSGTRFGARPKLIELLDTPLGLPISEAISFYREAEFILLLEKLAGKKENELTQDEKQFLDALRAIGDLRTIILENKFIVMEWRILRFLRAIGDVRINMGKQSAKEFIEWAHQQTGLSKKLLYDQVFTFQDNPGYAPCYCMAGEELGKIQSLAVKNGKSVVHFNTYVSSIGFLPRTIYEKRLREYAMSTKSSSKS